MNNKKSKKYKYYPMHMHIHASCDKGSSMALNMYNASKLGMKYIWFTDHDTRMGLMKNYIREYSFGDGLLKTDGKVYQGFEKISNQTDLLINADEKTLTINSAESVDEWVSSGVYFTSSGKRHTYSLASGLGLSINVEEVSLEQNSRLIFAVKLSQRPPYMKNAYILYVMGDTDGLRGEYNQIITINKTCGKITLNLSEDALDDQNIGGKDNAFDTLYILIQTRNGAKASVKVSDFKIQRGKICEDLRQSLQQVADNAGKPYEVKPFVAFEVSEAGEHKNCFSLDVPVLEYHDNNYCISESEAIEHIKKHNGIFAINHPFATNPFKRLGELDKETKDKLLNDLYNEFVENNALGATLMEVGFPMGRRFPFEYYLKLWDMLSLKGIFLTGYGANDCHANNDGWFEGNNFVAYIGVDPDLEYPIDVKHFINAMKKGRVYTGDPTKIKGEISFETENGEQMGSVIKVKDNEEIKMKFNADNVTPGWKFRLVENGETVETCQITENIFEYESKLNLKGGILSFRRAEIWDETGKCILLTNPIYVVNNLFISEHSDDVRVTQRLCVPHKIYVTHHGQVDDSLISDFESIPLTDLGTEQSKKTGEYLKYKGFCGKIYYTPYSCTKETAEIIASYTGSEVILFDGTQNLKEELEKLSLMEDLLFVTTSEIHENIGKLFGMKMNERACNCSLSTVNTNGKAVYADPSHMPYKMRGFNTKMCSDIDFKTIQDYMKDDESIFDEIAKEKGTKLLHISDTTSFSYPYIKRLVNKVKPDIIIHTGDFVDEVKAGRMINTFDEYESGVKEICNILTSSSAKEIYAVCGNNDIFDVLKKHLPNAKVSMPGSVEKICGIDCLLAHGPTQVTDETQWAFYGHGLTGECWSPDKNNVKSGRCRFNAIWNLSVITLPERKQYVIKHPVYRK